MFSVIVPERGNLFTMVASSLVLRSTMLSPHESFCLLLAPPPLRQNMGGLTCVFFCTKRLHILFDMFRFCLLCSNPDSVLQIMKMERQGLDFGVSIQLS